MPDQARLHLCRTHFAPSHVERLVGPPLRKPAAVRIHAGDGSKLRASSKAPVWCTPGSPTGLARAGPARRKRPWPCPAMVRPACQETATLNDSSARPSRNQQPSASTLGMVPNSAWMRTARSEEHTSELQSPCNLVCRLLLEK